MACSEVPYLIGLILTSLGRLLPLADQPHLDHLKTTGRIHVLGLASPTNEESIKLSEEIKQPNRENVQIRREPR